MPITINNVRFSYCNLFQAVARQAGAEPRFSVTVLVPKSNIQAKAAIDAAVNEAISAGPAKCWNGQRPPMPSICVHDGDGPRPSDGQPFGEECHGCWVFTASSKQPPFVVDANVQNIINPTEVYSGMWGNVNINFFPYNNSGKKGVGCGLNGVQKIRDGEALAGRVSAEEAFGAPQQPVTPTYAPAPAGMPWGAPAAPAYPQPAYQQPTSAPAINPFTGQPYPAGAPIMGL